jgi:uncharacterized repeat protein (TIGR01451 family)
MINVTSTPATCPQDSNGTVTANVSGGTAPYSYIWSSGHTLQTVIGRVQGIYNVTVTDAIGNVNNSTGFVSELSPNPINVMVISVIDPSCNGSNDGAASVSVQGGVPIWGYTYLWPGNGIGQNSPNATGLTTGNHVITVLDSYGCSGVDSFTLTEPDSLVGDFIITPLSSCYSNDGRIEVVAQGGSGNLYYTWNTNHSFQTTTIDSLSRGQIISVTITDDNGCTLQLSDTMAAIYPQISYTPTVCNGDSTGVLELDTIIGGIPPYTYNWSPSITQTGPVITGLGVGTYTIVVTDSTNCVDTATISISNSILVTSIVDNLNGSATANVQGGTAPYSYLWGSNSNFQTTATIMGLSNHNIHRVTVTDFYGCTTIDSIKKNRISGYIYHDLNRNCYPDFSEGAIIGRNLIINPGNIITTTNSNGLWGIESLPIGQYTMTVDTNGSWSTVCPTPFLFSVSHPDSIVAVSPIGLFSAFDCPSPNVSIYPSSLRPGLNQTIRVYACNQRIGTYSIDSAYIVVELDTLISVQSASVPFTYLGGNKYSFFIDTLYPGDRSSISIQSKLNSNAIVGQALCIKASLFPTYSCSLDTIPNPFPNGISPCNTTYDDSHLTVNSSCINNNIQFVIKNEGIGDMSCFSQIRILVDTQLVSIDSIQLISGDSLIIPIVGDSRTWRLEVDQHPLHLGNSSPSSTIELCGGMSNWTSGLFNAFPHDDADPSIDIFCGEATNSFDPNDKTGYPLGIGTANNIDPNQDLEYLIRFQNTGTDTAFTVVIRDTLSNLFDIFSVQSEVSSHDYSFRMYGQRILEWTFSNIMLPDSNINEAASHGFIKFKVKQNPNLPIGTLIENSAAIYFDFNAPIITNTSWHTINEDFISVSVNQVLEEKLQIKFYPNPTTGLIYIDKKDNTEINIQVIDNLGRLLLVRKSNEKITTLNIKTFVNGVYFISINNGKQTAIQKVIKN